MAIKFKADQRWKVRYMRDNKTWTEVPGEVAEGFESLFDHEHESACERACDLDGQVRVQIDGNVVYIIVEDENCNQLEVTRIEEVK